MGSCCTKSPAREAAAIINCWAGNWPTCVRCLSRPTAPGRDRAVSGRWGAKHFHTHPPPSHPTRPTPPVPGKTLHHRPVLAMQKRGTCFHLICRFCIFFPASPWQISRHPLQNRLSGDPFPNSSHCSPRKMFTCTWLQCRQAGGALSLPSLYLPTALNGLIVTNTTSDK